MAPTQTPVIVRVENYLEWLATGQTFQSERKEAEMTYNVAVPLIDL